MRLNRRSQTSLSTDRIGRRLSLALHHQQYVALSWEKRESEELLPTGNWTVLGNGNALLGNDRNRPWGHQP